MKRLQHFLRRALLRLKAIRVAVKAMAGKIDLRDRFRLRNGNMMEKHIYIYIVEYISNNDIYIYILDNI